MTAWVRRHQDGLWRYLRFLGCPADLAPDLMQDALLAALAKRIHEARTDEVAGRWLRATVSNLFRSQLRRTSRRGEAEWLPEHEAEAAWQHHARDGGDEYLGALKDCLAEMQPRHRRAVELRYCEKASRREMADELAISQQGVKTMLRRLRDGLRECVTSKLAVEGPGGRRS